MRAKLTLVFFALALTLPAAARVQETPLFEQFSTRLEQLSPHAKLRVKSSKRPEPVRYVLPPVENLSALDMPYDAGETVLLKWKAMPYDGPSAGYEVYFSSNPAGPWIQAETFPADKNYASDVNLPFWAWKPDKNLHAVKAGISAACADKTPCYFKVVSLKDGARAESGIVSAAAKGNWFNLPRLNNFIYALCIVVVFLLLTSHAKRGNLFIRRIAGLDAVDEAIGRATEMGKPILYSPGIEVMSNMATISSTFVLSEIAKKAAAYETQLKVPHYDPVVMSVCKEVVKQAYLEAGRPDAYREDINYFISQDQFSYAATVDGIISREKPAACFFMGYFMAESLLLTEVGSTIGAIQIAGTNSESQLPFFFTSCDYTLIGEELFAAGAYISKDPVLVATLKSQDAGKFFVMVAVVFGLAAVTAGTLLGWNGFVKAVTDIFSSF